MKSLSTFLFLLFLILLPALAVGQAAEPLPDPPVLLDEQLPPLNLRVTQLEDGYAFSARNGAGYVTEDILFDQIRGRMVFITTPREFWTPPDGVPADALLHYIVGYIPAQVATGEPFLAEVYVRNPPSAD